MAFGDKPWCAYADETIVDDDTKLPMVAYVEEGEPGYYPTTYVGEITYVQRVVDSINESLGVTKERALEIVSSSMAAGAVRD